MYTYILNDPPATQEGATMDKPIKVSPPTSNGHIRPLLAATIVVNVLRVGCIKEVRVRLIAL